MDEGINSFYEYKYVDEKYGRQTKEKELIFQTIAKANRDQPIGTSSEDFNVLNYDLVAYHKTAEWMMYLEKTMGSALFSDLMHTYYKEWCFKHPYPEDFRNIAQKYLGSKTDSIFSLIHSYGILPDHHLSGARIITPLNKKAFTTYLQNPVKDLVLISPVIGANSYDKLMPGLLITNYKVPPSKVQFFVAPLYGTGSKKFTGIGKINYTINSKNFISKTDIFINGSDFSMDQFIDSSGNKFIMKFQKLVPGIRLTFKEKNPRSTINKYIQWKTYLIKEQTLDSKIDTLLNNTDTSIQFQYSTPSQNRHLNQLQFFYENYRALYPFDVRLQVEQSSDFIRPAITANYFFNYPKEGGLALRFFAGKFIYLGGKTIQKEFNNDRYFLNMTGPNGYEDYTYSDYFIGRNKFNGLASQQIMIRDGAFKVRTDLLANKIGKTDNWLTSVNLVSTVPKNINPLSVLPVKIPLRIFFDLGTFADAWNKNQDNDRFLYDLGLQIPLFDETVNIYIPFLYNKVYRDYFKSTITEKRFLKTISFSINMYNKDLRKINHELQY
jgi:hypothetical protein